MKIKMKKVLCALFAIILVCAGLSACEKSPCYAKITYSDGSSEMLDMKKFKDLHYQNKYAYNKKYSGNKIEAVDRISSISSSRSDAIISTSDWTFFLDDDNPIIVDLREGTLVKFYGELAGATNGNPLVFVDTIEIIEEK
jgi:hypothetical protein